MPDNIYAMTDEYSASAKDPLTDGDREAAARLMYELVKLLMKDGFTPGQRRTLAEQHGVAHDRAVRVEQFLLFWGLDDDE